MNRLEAAGFLNSFFAGLENAGPDPARARIGPFLDLVFSLKKDFLSVPLLRDLSAFSRAAFSRTALSRGAPEREAGLLRRRIDRRYSRLCRVQEELGRLDLKNSAAAAKTSLEDYVFSRIDFSRYREMDENVFNGLFPEGLDDFSESFFTKNFGMGRAEIRSLIEKGYVKSDGLRRLRRENQREEFLALSVMRTLETSLEASPLYSAGEIEGELKNLLDYVHGHASAGAGRRTELIFPLLVRSLDNKQVTHEDGMTTKLFVVQSGGLSGTFTPGGKPWTLMLVAPFVAENRDANPY